MNNKIEFIPLMVVEKESIHVVTVDFEYQFIEGDCLAYIGKSFFKMLGLKLPTDPRWVNIAEKILKILIDHAFCEQKAASTAISLIVTYPEYSDLVTAMTALAKEEMSHFQLVHQKLLERGLSLGRERKDQYVHDIIDFFSKTSIEKRV